MSSQSRSFISSTWSLGSKSKDGLSPQVRSSTLALSSGPSGTSSAGGLGQASISVSICALRGARRSVCSFTLALMVLRRSRATCLLSPCSVATCLPRAFCSALACSCRRISPRRSSSSASRASTSKSMPLRAAPRRTSSGCSRIQARSSMVAASPGRPIRWPVAGPAAPKRMMPARARGHQDSSGFETAGPGRHVSPSLKGHAATTPPRATPLVLPLPRHPSRGRWTRGPGAGGSVPGRSRPPPGRRALPDRPAA